VLFLASDGDTLNTTAVAEALDIHLSNASRVCDRLVTAGFLNRRESAADRRNVQLSLTPTGRELVSSVVAHRRATFLRVLQRMSPGQRAELAAGLRSFSDAADEDAGHRPTQP
jgi:DNA-binding MarR family transcriptional regulator